MGLSTAVLEQLLARRYELVPNAVTCLLLWPCFLVCVIPMEEFERLDLDAGAKLLANKIIDRKYLPKAIVRK